MTLDKIHDFLGFIIDKERADWYSPPELDTVLERAQMTYFNELLPVKQYEINNLVSSRLNPFKVNVSFVTDSAGIVTLPDDLLHGLSINTVVADVDAGRNVYHAVQIINESELIERLESQVIVVGLSNPFGIENGRLVIQLYPPSTQIGRVYYLRKPATPFYNFTQVGRAVTYVTLGSTQMEWADQDMNIIMMKALQFLGINMQAGDVVAAVTALSK